MNDHEIERVAAAMNALRPDWPVKSLTTLLRKPELANRPRRDITVALAWVACESGTATPARVLEAGPWWRAVTVEANSVHIENLAPEERCKTCGKSQHDCQRNPFNAHPTLGHAFEPDIKRPRDTDLHPVVTELKDHVAGASA